MRLAGTTKPTYVKCLEEFMPHDKKLMFVNVIILTIISQTHRKIIKN